MTRLLIILPAMHTVRFSSSLKDSLISVENALVGYSAAGYGSMPICRSSSKLLRRFISCSLKSNTFICIYSVLSSAKLRILSDLTNESDKLQKFRMSNLLLIFLKSLIGCHSCDLFQKSAFFFTNYFLNSFGIKIRASLLMVYPLWSPGTS